MKLQIKTLARKRLVIDIDGTKTVYALKSELSHYPDVGVQPELQKLIYNGKVLNDGDQLHACKIDVKKFLVVMMLKQPEVVPAIVMSSTKRANTNDEGSTPTTTTIIAAAAQSSAGAATIITPPPETNADKRTQTVVKSPTEDVLAQITAMGYPEQEARRALDASFNNVERAIEYLIEGIPSTGVGQQQLQRAAVNNGGVGLSRSVDNEWTDTDDDDDAGDDAPMEMLRRDPLFQALRESVVQNPAIMDMVVQQICGENQQLLELVNGNREEFLRALIDDDDFDDDDNDDGDENA